MAREEGAKTSDSAPPRRVRSGTHPKGLFIHLIIRSSICGAGCFCFRHSRSGILRLFAGVALQFHIACDLLC